MSRAQIRVIVVDGHDLFRQGLADMLGEQGFDVAGSASHGDEALRLVAAANPDVVVTDVDVPGLGRATVRRLAEASDDTRLLALTVSTAGEGVLAALIDGASGYVLKDDPIEQISQAVRAAAEGNAPIAPAAAVALVERLRLHVGDRREPAADSQLTPRELEILRLVAAGRENAEIAERLVISQPTVKNHISSILAKLGVDNRIQAAVYAVREGLL